MIWRRTRELFFDPSLGWIPVDPNKLAVTIEARVEIDHEIFASVATEKEPSTLASLETLKERVPLVGTLRLRHPSVTDAENRRERERRERARECISVWWAYLESAERLAEKVAS